MTQQKTRPALDQLFVALSKPTRRRVLTALSDASPLEADEFTPADFADDGEDLDRILCSIYHNHLPHLHDAGFIEWDRKAERITRGHRYDDIEPLLRLMHDHQDELPESWP